MSDYLTGINLKLHLREAAIIIGAVIKANADVALVTGPPAKGTEAVRTRISLESADFIGKFKDAYAALHHAMNELNEEKEQTK